MMKIACCLAFLLFTITSVSAQETIDKRLVKNRGKQAEEAFIHNKNSYNYYLFELDKGHWMTTVSELDNNQKSLLQPAENFKNEHGQSLSYTEAISETFNFYDYGIRIAKEQRLYVALDEEHVIVFYSIPELSKLFSNSEFNTKK
ncbi:MAG: hypothetical protein QE487_04465 [Fluviicola sp.]|nr:hypothetical protein [Fluviicola sp.]